MSAPFTGTGHLLRLILRRDRVRLPLWVAGLGGVIAASAYAVPEAYGTPEKIAGYEKTVGDSAVSFLMSGRQAALDTIGGITANEIGQVATLGICLMVLFLVVRHTRAEEESGRAEMLRSTVLGRHAATLSATLYAVAAAVLIGAITTAAMIGADLEVTGSLAYGASLTLLGVTFAGVSVAAAQLSTSARGALAIGGTAIALAYLVRGFGAINDNWLVWLSPFGWAQEIDAFGAERWWTLGLLAAATVVAFAVAAYLAEHRDFAGGLLQERPGSPRATRVLGTSPGLAFCLQRGTLIGWTAGLFILAVIYGAVVPMIPELLESNPDIGKTLGIEGGDLEAAAINSFLSYSYVFLAMLTGAFAVASVLRLRSEEEAGRAEALLATGLSRVGWVVGSLAVTVVGTLVILVLNGIGIALGYSFGMSEWDRVGEIVVDQLSFAPGVLVLVGFAMALTGLLPRWTMLAWALVAVVFLQSLLGDTLKFPSWVDGISPLWHLPRVPSESFEVTPGLVLLVISAALAAAGVLGVRRRDIG
ncbi:ABC transporter permease [Nocardioides speluncae]|uniref:ABC transporter permease n=1 Tax=Nocardioides speluncae TaxID=2670337 RepID=UPI000D686127|nr:hypothetical protein [Nocardioides speluncae]